MKNVLMVVYYFPPLGSVQVLRALKFAKYLPEFGWKPFILAVKPISHYYYDPNLLKELTPEVETIYTESLDPFRIMAIFSKKKSEHNSKVKKQESSSFFSFRDTFNNLNRWIALPDSRFGWYPFAVSGGFKAIHEQKIDLIYSSCPPNIAHLVGLKLHQKTGLPWVADFKDLWSDYPHAHPTEWHRKKMNKWEKKIVSNASSVVSINSAITEDFQNRHPTLKRDKFITLVHGYDSQEYQGINRQQNSIFTIVHTGSFFEPRQIPDYFLKALAELLKEKTELKDKIQVQLVGTMTSRHRELIQKLQLRTIIQLEGSVNRKNSIQCQMNADILLLFVGKGSRSELVLPAKTWEYLATGHPILCLAPDGVTANLIKEHSAGLVVQPDDIESIKRSILNLYEKYSTKTLQNQPLLQYSQYDRKAITGQLAAIFNQISKT